MTSRYKQFSQHLRDLSDDERTRVLASTQGQAYLYAEAVSQQARRLRDSHSVTHVEHQADAVLFAFALKALFSLGELVLNFADRIDTASVAAAMDGLHAAAPDTASVRDALAHLDEYLAGFGKRQADGVPFLPWFARNGSAYTVMVGPLLIEVDTAEQAAIEVASAIMLLDL